MKTWVTLLYRGDVIDNYLEQNLEIIQTFWFVRLNEGEQCWSVDMAGAKICSGVPIPSLWCELRP